MRTRIIFILILISTILSSCLVKSLHPFYKERDVVFNESLIGTWIDQDSSIWEFEQHKVAVKFMSPEKPVDYYHVKLVDEEDGNSYFEVRLFRLNSRFYLDFLPLTEENIGDNMASFHFIPSHSIARIEFFGKNNVAFFWYDQDWLKSLFEERRVKISHEQIGEEDWVLTAETDELQKFIIKYGEEPDMFLRIGPEIYDFNGTSLEYHEIIEKEIDKVNDSSLPSGTENLVYINMYRSSK